MRVRLDLCVPQTTVALGLRSVALSALKGDGQNLKDRVGGGGGGRAKVCRFGENPGQALHDWEEKKSRSPHCGHHLFQTISCLELR